MRTFALAAFAALAACGSEQTETTSASDTTHPTTIAEIAKETVEECMARNNPSPSNVDEYRKFCAEQLAWFADAANGGTFVDGNGNRRSKAEALESLKKRFEQ